MQEIVYPVCAENLILQGGVVDVMNSKNIVKVDADSAWFSWFQKNKKDNLTRVLQQSLGRIEDSGINLGKIFSVDSINR